MGTGNGLLDFLLHPAPWWTMLVVWVIWRVRARSAPGVIPEFDKKRAKPGDLYGDGSTATSNTEKKVRQVIEDAGYRLYPPSTRVYTPKDGVGKNRKYTPDIMLKKPKMIVEVDPHYWHGDPKKIADDIDRNRMYARLGYIVVRVRIAGTLELSPNDVVIPDQDFNPDRDAKALLKGIRKAKFIPAKYWENPNRLIARGNAANAGLTADQRRAMGMPTPNMPNW